MKLRRVIPLFLLTYLTCGCATAGDLNRVQHPVRNAEVQVGSGTAQKQTQPLRTLSKHESQKNNDAITWYTGGETRISLNAVPADLSSSVVIAGTTSEKTLIVMVAKNGGAGRSSPVPLAADGSFNVRYLIKDGSGTYTVTFLGSRQKNALSYQGLGFFTHTVKEPLPANLLHLELNGEVLAFVNRVMGSSVGRGECWDLAQQALDMNLADWARPTSFGLPLNPEIDEIRAGDIIQFSNLKTAEHLPGGVIKSEILGTPDHTAVIYKVLGQKHYTLAHQNVGGKRTVMKSDINLAHVTGGQFWLYRPVALMTRN